VSDQSFADHIAPVEPVEGCFGVAGQALVSVISYEKRVETYNRSPRTVCESLKGR